MTTTPATAPTTTGMTIAAASLHTLLVDLAVSAADSLAPSLEGAFLQTEPAPAGAELPAVLVGTSTDRYLAGQAHEPATGALPATFVPLTAMQMMTAALEAHGEPNPTDDYGNPLPASQPRLFGTVQLARHEDSLTLTLFGDSITITVPPLEFPAAAIWKVLGAPRPSTGSDAAIPVEIWQKLGRIADRRQEPVAIRVHTLTEPLCVHIGARYRALVTPMKPDSVQARPSLYPLATPECAR